MEEQNLLRQKKLYKKNLNYARKTFNKKMNSKLRSLKDKDPEKFCSVINDKKTEPIKEIQIETLYKYFLESEFYWNDYRGLRSNS